MDEGKKRLYHDADIIEGLLKSKLLKIRNPKKTVEQEENLGDGEMSVLALSKETGDHIVVSDDRAFIKKLEEENQSYHVPLDLIALLKKLGKISQNDAMKYLEKIKIFVREADYTKIKKELEEK
ncbi:hypothetical protein HYU10_02325 [Candidatus Woesearchaeota archaeon]|nr:hypothetical protein [Candidatus Woesearchaeota archaeon]MBI2130583.1 hypothetical protein [Candidatus Woesearchaeota archaeon]MBI2661247.1 hypothetical protein [Candidatus Woesearchaeota archaeon]